MGAVDAQGLAELGRAAAQVAVAPGGRPGRAASRRGRRAVRAARSSTARRLAVGAAHDVGAPVHAVGEVHVQVTRRAEHRLASAASGPGRRGCPGRRPPRVRLDLDDPRRPDRPWTSTLLSSSGATTRPSLGQQPTADTHLAGPGPSGGPQRPQPDPVGRAAARRTPRAARPRAPGPAPPGVVRRRTDDPGLEQGRRPRARARGLRRPGRPGRSPRRGCAARARRRRRGPRGTARPRRRGTRPGRWPPRSGVVGGRGHGLGARRSTVASSPVMAAERQRAPGRGVEQRLLVLLEVAVVGERAAPLRVASRPVRLPMRRPVLPRASSAMSGFFFCGSIEDPVA